MKTFFVDKYSVLTFFIVIAASFFIISFANSSEPVYSSFGNMLPIYSVETKEKAVSITFDTAWGCEDIDAILSALYTSDCKATFFISGKWLSSYPEEAEKIFKAGHEIANHGNAHEHFSSLSNQQMADSINECDKKIKSITGKDNLLFRAPYGEYNKTLVSVCRFMGRYLVQWSIDTLDYKDLSLPQIKERIFQKLNNGDIILLHTGTKNTAAFLPEILREISDKGYKFKTVGELIYKDNFTIDHRGRQSSIN